MKPFPEVPIESFEVFADGLDHPEGLAFDPQGDLWAGGEAGQIYRVPPDGRPRLVASMEGFCGGLAFSPQGDLFVCNAKLGVVHVRPDGRWEVFADHVEGSPIQAANFPLFDRQGRLYVTDSGQWGKEDGFVLLFEPDGRGRRLAGPFGYANGLALSPRQDTLYLIESDTARVLALELTAQAEATGHRVVAEEVGRVPDGMALDCEGNLHVACYASDEIHVLRKDGTRRLLAHDPLGFRLGCPTNVAFGLADPCRIYVANLGRTTITRAVTPYQGRLPLAWA